MNRVVLIDDHELFRVAIANILENAHDLKVVNHYGKTDEAIRNVDSDQADLYLIDISLDEDDGLSVIDKLRSKAESAKLVVLSMHKEPFYVMRALEKNVDGYIHKDTSPYQFGKGIKQVLKGKTYYSSTVSNILINKMYSNSASSTALPSLTPREKEIIVLITEGLSSKEISEKLFISPRTVETHRSRIMKKYGIKNAAELVKLAVGNNLI